MEWIKVSDRLPEKGGEYLVTNGIECFIAEWLNPVNDVLDHQDITHWMPLPPPPKP